MNNQSWGLYMLQLLEYFVENHQYQVVTIRNNHKDLWLMNAQNEKYPVILLVEDIDQSLLSRQDYIMRVYRLVSQMTGRSEPLWILNSNPDASAMSTALFTQVRIQPGECLDEALKDAFPNVETALHEVENKDEEYARITKSLGEFQKKALEQRRKEAFSWKTLPKMSVGVIAFCIAIWLIALGVSNYLESDLLAALFCGAYYKMNVVSLHEFWRFLTAEIGRAHV